MIKKPTYEELEKRVQELERVEIEYKQIRENLQQNKDLHQMFVDNAVDAFFLSDINGRFIDVNKAACTALGYTREEFLGMTISDVDVNFPSDKLSEILGNLTYNESQVVESIHKKKNGEIFPVNVQIRSFGPKEQPLLVSFARDVTERRQAEETLKKRESQLRQIIDLVPHFIFVKDETGKFEIVNKATAEVFGTTVEDLTGRRDSEFVATEEEMEHFRSDDLEVIRSGKTKFIPEEPITDSNNNLRYLQTTKVPFKFSATTKPSLLGVGVDITERKQIENDLKKKTYDLGERIKELKCLYAVSTLFEDTKIPLEEIFQNIAEFIIPAWQYPEITCSRITIDDNQYIAGKFKETNWGQSSKVIVNGEQVGTVDVYYLEEKPGMNEGPFLKEERKLINDIAERISRTIEQKNAVENSKKLEAQIQQAQKMESIGTLAGGIAHDFNNILFPIIGLTEMLIETVQDEKIKADLNHILKAGNRATDLVKQILTFSRKHQHEVRSLLLQPILKESIKLSRAAIPSNIKIEQNIDKTCAPVMADAVQIHQVVMNLITNAYQAMDKPGGVLSISLYEEYIDESFSVLWENKNKKCACIEIKDSGCGMDKKTLENIFQPYFTTKEKAKGTGLGLAVSHGIIAGFGGEIKVKSEIGKGSCFNVFLPITSQEINDEIKPKYKYARGNLEKLLIIDDEKPILNMLQVMLLKSNYQVEAYSDSIKALESFKTSPENYDLIISDLTMPDMTGDKLCLEVKKIYPEIPVIILTGYNEKNILGNMQDLGIDRVLTKPVSKYRLLSIISELINCELI